MKKLSGALVLMSALAFTFAACGSSGDSKRTTSGDASASAVEGSGSTMGSMVGGDEIVTIVMTDNKFTPNKLTVKAGQTVHFLFKNEGKLKHEAIFGDEQTQLEHEQMMVQMSIKEAQGSAVASITSHDDGENPDHTHLDQMGSMMDGHMGSDVGSMMTDHMGSDMGSDMAHAHDHAVSLDPGKSVTQSYTFDQAGTTYVGCHQPNHYADGMRIEITVKP